MTPWWQPITRIRLASWAAKLDQEHATPLLLVGVSHADKSGQIVLITTEDENTATIIAFLRFAIAQLSS